MIKSTLPKQLVNGNKSAQSSTSKKIEGNATSFTDSKSAGGAKSSSPVVGFNASNVSVVGVKPNGTVTLSVKADVDPIAAVKNGVNVLDISLRTPVAVEPGKSTVDPANALDMILNSSNDVLRSQMKSDSMIVKKVNADITSNISNTIASSVSKVDALSAQQLIGSQTVLKTLTLSEAQAATGRSSGPTTVNNLDTLSPSKFQNDIDVPVMDTPMSTAKMFNVAEITPRQLAVDMLLKDGKSPSIAAVTFSPIIDTSNALGGTSAQTNKGNDFPVTARVTSADARENALVGALMGSKNEDISSASDLARSSRAPSQESVVTVPVKEQIKTVSVEKIIELTADQLAAIGNQVEIRVSPIDSLGNALQVSGCRIDISDRIKRFISRAAPLSATTVGDKVLPTVPQGPENLSSTVGTRATSTALSDVKKEVATGRGDDGHPPDAEVWIATVGSNTPIENKWVNIGEIDTKDVTAINTLRATLPPSTLVRFSNRGHSPPSPSFSEIFIPPANRKLTTSSFLFGRSTSSTDNTFVSVTTFVRKEGITVRLSGFQTSYIVSVVRKDHTIKEKEFSLINVVQPTALVDERTPSMIFVDTSVTDGHTYEYRAKIFTKTGREILSSKTSFITFRRLVENNANLQVSEPFVSTDIAGDVDVKFDVDVTLPDNGVSIVVDSLVQRGFDGYFTKDITRNRELLKDVTSFVIERVNMTDCEVERFPLFPGGTFSDRENRQLGNVSPIKINKEYRYVISVVSRNPDTLIPDVVRTKNDPKTGNQYDVLPAKAWHPETLRTGTVRRNLSPTSIDDEFMSGFLGVQVHVDINTRVQQPKIAGGSCKINVTGNVDINWRVEGDTNFIDHFVITAERMGMKSIVGRSHPFSQNGGYSFVDDVISGLPGHVRYFVIPVYVDYNQGPETSVGSVTIRDSKKVI